MKNSLNFTFGLLMTFSSISWAQSPQVILKRKLTPEESILRKKELDDLKTDFNIDEVTIERDILQPERPLALEFISNDSDTEDVSLLMAPQNIDKVSKVIGVTNELVALGQNIYSLVSNGKPNLTDDYIPISVVPRKKNVEPPEPVDWAKLWGWYPVITINYVQTFFSMKRLFTPVKLKYTIRYEYGGKYFPKGVKQNKNGLVTGGSGSYLSGIQIIPTKVEVNYGVDCDLTMRIGSITNSRPLHLASLGPKARAQIILEAKLKTMYKERMYTASFGFDGDGDFIEEANWGQ